MYSITAAGVLINAGDQFLLLKRHPSTLHPNMWGFIAGSIEDAEDAKAALVREIEEEINYAVSADDLEFIQHFYYPDFPEVNGNYELNFDLYQLSLPEKFDPELNYDEHLEYRWVSKSEALAMPDIIESLPDMLAAIS